MTTEEGRALRDELQRLGTQVALVVAKVDGMYEIVKRQNEAMVGDGELKLGLNARTTTLERQHTAMEKRLERASGNRGAWAKLIVAGAIGSTGTFIAQWAAKLVGK